jgi:hypothetical protein
VIWCCVTPWPSVVSCVNAVTPCRGEQHGSAEASTSRDGEYSCLRMVGRLGRQRQPPRGTVLTKPCRRAGGTGTACTAFGTTAPSFRPLAPGSTDTGTASGASWSSCGDHKHPIPAQKLFRLLLQLRGRDHLFRTAQNINTDSVTEPPSWVTERLQIS